MSTYRYPTLSESLNEENVGDKTGKVLSSCDVKEFNNFKNNPIKMGKNAEGNDKIISEANQTDVWFHLNNLPSCHVIIKCNKDNPITNEMINYCAGLVKFNTKFRNISKVTIIYTEIKNIRKTNIKGQVIIRGKTNNIIV